MTSGRSARDLSALFIYRAFHPIRGGVPKIIEEIGARIVADGGRATVLAARLDHFPESEVYRGIHVYRAEGFEQGVVPWRLLLRILQEREVNRVCVSDPLREEALLGWTAKLVGRVPVMLNLAGSYSEAASRWQRWSSGLMADSIVAISEYCRERFGYFRDRITVVPMGTEWPRPDPKRRRCRDLVASVGWVSRRKGYDELLDTAKLMPDVLFLVAGNKSIATDFVAHLEERLTDEGIDNVRFLGQVSDRRLSQLLSRAKVFFLPTTHEMFGIAFLDAMAHGLPVVSRPVAAVPEAVTPDVGILVDGDASGFAEAIRRLQNDDGLWRDMSVAALERARQHTWELSYRAYLSRLLYRVKAA